MTATMPTLRTPILEAVLDHLDIPRSYYEKAVARHKSLGEWLCRPNSTIACLNPHCRRKAHFGTGP